MKKMLLFLTILMLLFFIGCDDTVKVEDEIDESIANEFARSGFTLLNEMLLDLEEPDDPQSGDDIFPEADYNLIKNFFEQALDESPDNALANFGMAVLEIASVNYDPELWDLINDFDDEFGERRLFNNQFSFLVKTPLIYLEYLNSPLSEDELSLARIQNFIEDNVFPKIENAIEHLNTAIALPDSVTIIIDTDEELLELDRAEIYAFRVGTYAISAAMRMLILYDFDMFDENGTYDWIDDLGEESEDCEYEYDPDTQELFIEYHEHAQDELILTQVVNYNHTQRPEFLAFRSGQDPSYIQDDLNNILADLQNIVDYVTAETDDQSDDIIQYDHIIEMNNDIGEIDEDDPNFVQNWQTVDDVIDWVSSLIAGPITFNEDFDDDGIDEELTLDLSRLFDPGLDDMRDYLPYHQWLPEEEWLIDELDWEDDWYNGGYSYSFGCGDDWIQIDNVQHIYEEYYNEYINPIEFLDGPGGNVIDLEDELPYLPDYTLNGVFPDMTRDQWLDLFGIDE
jgi:hypothetical protein